MLVTEQNSAIQGMVCRCPACGQRYEYEKLLTLRPRMVQVKVVEKQPANTVPLTIWVYPEPLEVMRQRFPVNFMTTMTALFTAIADPDTLLVEGEHGRAIKAAGVLKGRDLEGLGPYIKQLEQDVEDARVRERALGPLLGMMQLLQGAQAGGGVPMIRPLPGEAAAAAAATPSSHISPDHYAADYVEEDDPYQSAMLPAEPASPVVAERVDFSEFKFQGLPKPVPSGR
jgi:hypothetical protein